MGAEQSGACGGTESTVGQAAGVAVAADGRLQLRCEVCGADRVRRLRRSEAHGFDVARCDDCKMVWAVNAPPPDVTHASYVDGGDPTPYTESQRGDDALRGEVLRHLRTLLDSRPGTPTLFDVGAGVGDFLVQARDDGFEPTGNELSEEVVQFAYHRHGFRLSLDSLAAQTPASVDVVTMWCVLAHVPDPQTFLEEALRMVRPGGILFLRTPRWCALDTMGIVAAKVSGERLPQLADRRVTPAHLHLYNEDSLHRLLTEVGFVDIELHPTCHYPFTTDVYLDSTLPGKRAIRALSAGLDRLIEGDRFIRNALLVYARRPR